VYFDLDIVSQTFQFSMVSFNDLLIRIFWRFIGNDDATSSFSLQFTGLSKAKRVMSSKLHVIGNYDPVPTWLSKNDLFYGQLFRVAVTDR
jgi:hypothetical protein